MLLDTNIVVHRESKSPVEPEIGKLFRWIEQSGYEKWIHPVTIEELSRNRNEGARKAFEIKLENYHLLPTVAPLDPSVAKVGLKYDKSENDRADTTLLNELYVGRVDGLLTEDRMIHLKARELGLQTSVFKIDSFLEKATAEHVELVEYDVLSVRKEYIGAVQLNDPFFDSFREDYTGFDRWFNSKSDQIAYVCRSADTIVAFLYLKVEEKHESYDDIFPTFQPFRRLKIGTFKVILNGMKIGERFVKIIFDNALAQEVEEIYLTVFPTGIERDRLIKLIEDFGFIYWGTKKSDREEDEHVYYRKMTRKADRIHPKMTYPFASKSTRKFIVPIYPEYHTNLFPDSILRTESPEDFEEHEPHRNALSKIYISRSYNRTLSPGDLIVFYRTGGLYRGVVSTLGIVERIEDGFSGEKEFIETCRRRSVFSDDELRKHWDYNPRSRPFVVSFLFMCSFPRRPNLKTLIEHGIISDVHSVPRGFEEINNDQFESILGLAEVDASLIVD